MTKLSPELDKAIFSIFSDPGEAYFLLGIDKIDDLEQEKPASIKIDPIKRANLLKNTIENWLEVYGQEMEEFDTERDKMRIYFEARALLLVLREIRSSFPELDQDKLRD